MSSRPSENPSRVAPLSARPGWGGSLFFITILCIGAPFVPAQSSPAVTPPDPSLKSFATGCKALAYQEYGAGQPIVILAGGPGMNPAYMIPVAKMLAAGGRRAVLLHQRGSGRSADAITCQHRMNLDGAIADLEDLRTHLHLDKLTLAGHSWGGMLAMAFAQKHPDRVGALLLLDPGPLSHTAFSVEDAVIQSRLTPEERSAVHAANGEAQIDAIERRVFFADADNVRGLQQSIPPGQPLWYESVGKVLAPQIANFDVTAGMRNLKAPVTMVFGHLDPGFFIAQQIQDVQPRARLIVIEHAGHYPWFEDPARTAAILKTTAIALP